MNTLSIILLAIALGIDCLIVSFMQGLIYETNKLRNSLLLGFTMGFFQWFMPIIGYFATISVIAYIKPYSKWIIFLIFLSLGLKFIIESFKTEKEEKIYINFKTLIGMGILTSIDALFAGVSLKLSDTSLMFSTLIIGFMSFFLSIFGFKIANIFKKLPSNILEILGGLILISLAIKALI